MLARMGAKPDKSPRTPACIGYGMAKKQVRWVPAGRVHSDVAATRARESALVSGCVQ